MNARVVLVALAQVLAGGCGGDETAKPAVFELRDVVAPRLAELGALAPSTPTPLAPASEQLREELLGMLATLALPRSGMREAVLVDFRSREELAIPLLQEVLNDPSQESGLRGAAIEVLAAMNSPASIELLVQALQSKLEPWVRAQCAWRLAGTGQDRFLPRILLRLRYEADEETAIWLGDCLASLGNHAGVDGMCVVRNRARTPELAEFAAEHLAALAARAGVEDGDALNAQWRSGELEARLGVPAPSKGLEFETWKCIQALGEWDLRVVDDRRFVLTHMNSWVVKALEQTLHEKNVYLRVHAAQCLERMGMRARSAGPELTSALDEPRLAPAAAAALGALRWTEATARLEAALLDERNLELCTAAARALGELAQARSVPPLRQAFGPDQVADLRQAAAESLCAFDPARDVIEFLCERMIAPRAEAISAENALARWLARKAQGEAQAFESIQREWIALDATPPDAIATREQVAARLAARAELVKSRVIGSLVR